MSRPPTTVGNPSIKTFSSVAATPGQLASVRDSFGPGNTSTVRPDIFGDHNRVTSVSGQSDLNARLDRHQASPQSATPTLSRPLGVHSILNPSADVGQSSSTGVSNRMQGFPNPNANVFQPSTSLLHSRKRGDPSSPQQETDVPHLSRPRRRVLTPKSPRGGSTSPGVRRNPSIHSTEARFQSHAGPESRIYTVEPGSSRGSDIPPLPSLVNTTRAPLPKIHLGDHSAFPAQASIIGTGLGRGASTNLTSQGDNFNAPLQTYNTGQTAGDYRFSSGHPIPQSSTSTFRNLPVGSSGGVSHDTQPHGPHEGYQSGPASYQMTLDTDRGPMVVPVELDLQQASKVADEKRKRNAGASARFRARRKEKEKEASHTISGLQRELRDLAEERDFYRNERNFFREIAARQGQHPARPVSPQAHRPVGPIGPASESSSSVTERYRDQSELTSGAQRRRTGDYHPALGGKTALSPPVPTYSPPATAYGTPFQSHPPLSLPPPTPTSGPYPSPRSLHPRTQPPPPPLPPSVTRSQSYDPFRRDLFDRSWNPGP